MKTKIKSLFTFIIIVFIIISVFFVGYDLWQRQEYKNPFAHISQALKHKQDTLPKIKIQAPVSGSVVSSPLEISGKAMGAWFFEGQFSVDVTDQYKYVIGTGSAIAQEDWMTEDFVPFEAKILFVKPDTKKGFIVLRREDMSGDGFPTEFDIPILFE